MTALVDRQTVRQRPAGRASMRQTWRELLFLHRTVVPERLTEHLPAELEIDTYEGRAWIGVVPFRMEHIRHPWLPALPGLRSTLELNVRTYVHYRGVPGVWFFSLDAAHPVAVWGARRFFHLPYFHAAMRLHRSGDEIDYRSRRTHHRSPEATFAATWQIGETLPEATPDSLEFFLTERYCLYTAHRHVLLRGRIFHPPWPLRSARLREMHSAMLGPLGLTEEQAPLVHYAESLAVEIFPLEQVGRVDGAWSTGEPATMMGRSQRQTGDGETVR